MIVKNEQAVIRRCLESVKPLIDYWVIVDTGSNDRTKEVIEETMRGIPGELHEQPWHNFEVNRGEALDFARGKSDFVLFIDADEVFVYDKGFQFDNLTNDFYYFLVKNEENGALTSEYLRILLINNHLKWHWQGVIHEQLLCPDAKTNARMEGIFNLSRTSEGARGKDPDKYLKDAAVLEEALRKDPANTRNIYYLAISYLNAGRLEECLKNFKRRVDLDPLNMPSNEVFNSLYLIGCVQMDLRMDSKTIIHSLSQAQQYDPTRAEPLYQLGCHFIDEENFWLANLTLRQARAMSKPETIRASQYIWDAIYDWRILQKLAECSFKMGDYTEAKTLLEELITKPTLPRDIHEAMVVNLKIIEGLN
jgi:glycosyltransferase involved in cell wall biosynthesis